MIGILVQKMNYYYTTTLGPIQTIPNPNGRSYYSMGYEMNQSSSEVDSVRAWAYDQMVGQVVIKDKNSIELPLLIIMPSYYPYF